MTNWNFKKFLVNDSAYEEILGGWDSPVIDMATANPKLYATLPEFAKVRRLRARMTIIAEFIFLCEHSERLVGLAQKRAHFFASGDYFSLHDLVDLKGGGLLAELEGLLRKYSEHMVKCGECRKRGNVCGECNNQDVLFPFGVSGGGGRRRCKECGHVYHKECYELLEATGAACKSCGKRG